MTPTLKAARERVEQELALDEPHRAIMVVQVADLRTILAALDEQEATKWRCFQCDFTTADPDEAAHHFGKYEDCLPACKIGVEQFRALENEVQTWRTESDAASKEFYSLGAAHHVALRKAEQEGYDKGLADGQAERALDEQEWQPIETAPRDRAIILIAINVRGEGPTVYEARWNEISECFSGRNGFLLFDGAHAWRPLPAPPVEPGT
jgi:hypothetical protein